MKKRFLNIAIYSFVFLLFLGLLGVVQASETQLDNYMEIKGFKQTNTAPTKAGHVFAGWYQEPTFDNPIGKNVNEGKYYAKFVSKEVLTVGCQLKENTTTESTSTALRLLTTVDTLKFSSVSFEFSGAGKNQELIATTAYPTIYGYTNSQGTKYEPNEHFGTESEYFIACKITGIPKEVFGETLTVTPKWTTKDGTVVRGTTRTFTIYDLAEPVRVDVYGSTRYHDDHTPWFNVSSNDPFLYSTDESYRYEASSGGIYVDGEKRTDAYLVKMFSNEYLIRFADNRPEKKTGLVIKIDGVFVDQSGVQNSKVKLGPVSFVCDGTNWRIYQDEVSVSSVTPDSKNFQFQVMPSTSFVHESGWEPKSIMYGGVYLNDSETPCGLQIYHISSTDYLVYWGDDTSITIEEGTKMQIDGVFGSTSRAARITSQTYEYVNGNWTLWTAPTEVDVYVSSRYHDDHTPWFNVSSNDPFLYSTDESYRYEAISGGIYVDGKKRTDAYLVKMFSNEYLIRFADGRPEKKAGLVIKMDGVFMDQNGAQDARAKLGPVSFICDGTNWRIYQDEVSVSSVTPDSKNFQFQVTPSTSFVHESGWEPKSIIYGGVYLNDSVTPCGLKIYHISATDYLVYWGDDTSITIEEGTKMRIDGVFGSTSYAAKITSPTYIYTNGNWEKAIEFVSEEGSEYVIARGKDASATEITAAKELQEYIKTISGVELPITSDATSPVAKEIVVGQTNRESQGDFDRNALGEDGFVIKTAGEKLWLVGGGERGTLYSVYAFLEEYLGCRFYTEQIEKVPESKTIVLPQNIKNEQKPQFTFRNAGWYDYVGSDISTKRNVNVEAWGRDIADNAGDGLSFAKDYMGHTFSIFVDPNEHFDSHPEYFSENASGERIKEGQLCLTNGEVLQLVIEEVREWLKENPNADFISVSQNDVQNPCLCDACEAVYNEEGGAYSGAIIQFVNAVADAIKDEYPNVKVITYAYQYSRSAPKTKPKDNVVVAFCTIEGCFSHSHSNECDVEANASYLNGTSNTILKDLQAWSALCGGKNLIVYDYGYNAWHANMTFANFASLRQNFNLYADNNVSGVWMEGAFQSQNAEFGELRAYLVSKLLWNPEMSEKDYYAHMDDFLEGVYGPGWEYVRQYIDLAQELGKDKHFSLSPNPEDIYPTEVVTNHTTGELPSDLTKTMMDNYTTTDWSKYWNWHTDVTENRITSEGRILFERALELAETEAQRQQIRKISSQIDYIYSYCYKAKIDAGAQTFKDLLTSFMTAQSYSSSDKAELSVTIKNYALSREYAKYVEFNRSLAERYVSYGMSEYKPSNSLSNWKTFNYANTPTGWQNTNDTVTLTASSENDDQTLSLTSSGDTFSATSSDWRDKYWAFSGGIYINGQKADIPLIKLYSDSWSFLYKYNYILCPHNFGYTVTNGMELKIDGTFGDGTTIYKLTSPTFVYVEDGSSGKWIQAIDVSIYDSVTTDTALHFEVGSEDTMDYASDKSKKYSALSGGIYLDDVLYSDIQVIKYDSGKYMIDWASYEIQPSKGQEVRIDGIFGNNEKTVKFASTTFTYDGNQNWMMHLEANTTGVADTALWIKTGPADTLAYTSVDWSCKYFAKTGGIYVNNVKEEDLSLIKLYSDSYLIYLQNAGYSATDGMTVTVDGVFGDDNNTFVIGPVTFIYDADQGVHGTWIKKE